MFGLTTTISLPTSTTTKITTTGNTPGNICIFGADISVSIRLLDITHAGDFITVSYNYLHDHWKGSLVGHSDSNSAEDTGHLLVTYHHNYFSNLNSRGPSFVSLPCHPYPSQIHTRANCCVRALQRFGTGHIFNNYYNALNDGINTRDGAQLLIENNVFVGMSDAM